MMSRGTTAFMPPWQRPSACVRALQGPCCCLQKLPWIIGMHIIKCKYGAGSLCCCCKRRALVPEDVDVQDELWVGGYTVPARFYELIKQGRIELHVASVQSVHPSGAMELSDGECTEPSPLIVCATGWGHNERFGFLPAQVRSDLGSGPDGMYLYRHVLHPAVPGIAFVGANISTVSSSLTSALQAKWLLELVLQAHTLPSRADMYTEIEEMQEWKRAVIPFQHDRGATVMMHQLYYHEELLQDMGRSTRLKRNCWLEVVQPYLPIDYISVLEQPPGMPGADGPRIGHSDGSGYVICTYVVCFLIAVLSVAGFGVALVWCALDQDSCNLKLPT
eukprot:TRINITY_DN2740_c0_g1_i5.p1 TRINITY_DN2740_c0_g1~~TRINITY_DN2740_c0_g1_i5.p1  ORF type:complete len:333 (-),score=72.86 TRINITY_DN2740_c0_g1_i5:1-999(-)